jgi:glycerate-2-kinase
METDPETLGIVVESHFHRAVLVGHGKAAGEMATELGEGREKKAGNLP